MIIKKLKLCHSTIYEPHVTNYEDNITYVEFLLGVLKKVNEVIDIVNSQSTFIDEFRAKYTELLEEFEEVKNKVDVEIPELINRRFAEIKSELEALIEGAKIELNSRITVEVNRLDGRIDNVAIGMIDVYDPTTGRISPLQQVINNLYDAGRSDALTAEEYDDLELTCTAFQAYDITAFDYDNKGKIILV